MKINSNRNRIIRFIILGSFFHFSGLNNGFTAVFSIQANAGELNMAPVIVQKAAWFVVPGHWKKMVQISQWKETLFHSSRVLECSSSRILSQILVQANLINLEKVSNPSKTAKQSKNQINQDKSPQDQSKYEEMLEELPQLTENMNKEDLQALLMLLAEDRDEVWMRKEAMHLMGGKFCKDHCVYHSGRRKRYEQNAFVLHGLKYPENRGTHAQERKVPLNHNSLGNPNDADDPDCIGSEQQNNISLPRQKSGFFNA